MGTIILPQKFYDKMDTQMALLASIASHIGSGGIEITSWDDLQRIVRMGVAGKILTVGDQLISSYGAGTIVWDIIGIDHDTPTDPRFTHSLTIQAHDCIGNVQFNTPEALHYAEVELAAGEHIFTLNSLKYKFTTTQAVPVGGQVVVSAWDGDTYVPTKIATYADDRKTTIETGLDVTPIESGEDTLPTVNYHQRCRYGSNEYINSAIRQWLNDDSSSFTWTPKTNFGRPPSSAPYTGAGFLNLLDQELAAVLGAVNKQVARNTVTDGGGQDIFSDKVFLLSRVEVYGGTEGTTTGEVAYPYYSALTTSPTSSALAGRIKYLSNSARYWWLRSPHAGYSNTPRSVEANGEISSNNASYTGGAAPACCII